MSEHNGQKPPAPLRFNGLDIPVVGQPFTIKGWFPTVLLVCNCRGKEPIMIPRGAGGQCPSCKRVYTIQQIHTPGIQFGIGILQPDGAASTDGAAATVTLS
jgi:hypothetical protein